MSMSVRSFAAKYPTWEVFMTAINHPRGEISAAAAHDMGEVLGEDISGLVGQVRGKGGSGNAGPYYQVYQDALTRKYDAIMRASHA